MEEKRKGDSVRRTFMEMYEKEFNKLSHFQNSVSFENGFGKTGKKTGFSFKSKVAFSKTEVLKKPQLSETQGDLSKEDERALRVVTMADTAMRVRKDLDPELAAKLEKEQFSIDYRDYLNAEFTIFEFAPKSTAARIFSEYLLFSITDEFDAEKIIDFEYLKENINGLYKNVPPDYKGYIDGLRRIYPWGRLIQ